MELFSQLDTTPSSLAILKIAVLAYLVVTGLIVGSFLNVVVARLPLGQSIVHPPSSCPVCGGLIWWRDNIPVVGYLRLRGKCRFCHTAISLRYPAVELLVAGLFTMLGVVELFGCGANLPVPNWHDGGDAAGRPYWFLDSRLLASLAYHCALVFFLLAVALIAVDRNPIPPRLPLAGAAVGVIAAGWFPFLLPIGIHRQAAVEWSGWTVALTGIAVGWIVGRSARWATRRSADALTPLALLVGAFMGWQAAFALGFAATLLDRCSRREPATTTDAALDLRPLVLAGVAVTQLFVWRFLTEVGPWSGPSHASGLVFPVVAWVLVLIGLSACRRFRGHGNPFSAPGA